MAVQAQYASNVFLLNRSGQDEFSLQQQGRVCIDQSHMLFNNGSNNSPRKRGREVEAAVINSFSLQTQPPQLIDISQLQRPNGVSTGIRLSFGDQQQHLQQNQSHEYQHQNLVPNSSAFWSIISNDLGTQIKRQREELDQYLQAQGDALRRTLLEKRHRHYQALLRAAEESVVRRLRDKEEEVEKAKRRNAELEARVAQLNVEAQVWQAKARAQEATAASLQEQLQQAIMSGGDAAVQDCRRAEECGEGAEDAESAYVDPERVVVASGPSCKACRTRLAAVVMLPCRHLCLCTECDRVAQACPICLILRNSTVEVIVDRF
ncbi:BOI-related E3 ubiquitin-protein ligase 1-like isoform X2 [Hibiscus syriacus]|uniref:BOI-related E3 ubiquitin-protein ligase 1-like isoform X2 n=1 Tax=Hibiscus syriacus TaxID=106335 RepID=UPI0019239995|nr:BOI-related E3 ubiquitin-protein ligase 1-like isoform X2 [Hibiscus syriacus]